MPIRSTNNWTLYSETSDTISTLCLKVAISSPHQFQSNWLTKNTSQHQALISLKNAHTQALRFHYLIHPNWFAYKPTPLPTIQSTPEVECHSINNSYSSKLLEIHRKESSLSIMELANPSRAHSQQLTAKTALPRPLAYLYQVPTQTVTAPHQNIPHW